MADVFTGSVIAGKYRLVSALSRGGMGSVWLADHLRLDAPVAVKFIRNSLLQDASMRERFEREAKAAAQIRSPYVVHVYDHGIDTGTPYIVMEYLEGHDLRHHLRGDATLSPARCVALCQQVCKGLNRAHRLGIIHRDLKPANIFLSEHDDQMAKILDFGIAKETGAHRVVEGSHTTTGQLLGSPHYMSPEQARGQPLDGRSDLWSLAVILFRCVTGERPFNAHDIGDLIVRICIEPAPAPSSLQPGLSPAIDAFFLKALAQNPAQRFANDRDFARAFREAVEGPGANQDDPDSSQSWHTQGQRTLAGLGGIGACLTAPLSDSSDRFGNLMVAGRRPSVEHTQVVGDDTLAATAAPTRRRRRRLVGGAVLATLLVGAAVLGALLRVQNKETAASVAPAGETEGPVLVASAAPVDATSAELRQPAVGQTPATASAPSASPPSSAAPVASAAPSSAARPKAGIVRTTRRRRNSTKSPKKTTRPSKPRPDLGY